MYAKRLELHNFGPHKSLVIEPGDKSVVGFIGKNGKGKSSVMIALDFIFNGSLPPGRPRKNWITHGQKTSWVSMNFFKDGKEGSITRWLSKSERTLTWDGREITVAAEVDSTFEGILDVDKKAFQSSSFTHQGDLDNLLFKGEANRRDVMVRLANASHLELRGKHIDQYLKAFKTKHNVGDIESLIKERDRLEVLKKEQQSELKLVDGKLTKLPVPEIEAFQTAGAQVERLKEHIERIEKELAGVDEKIEALSKEAGMTPEELNEKYQGLRKKVSDLDESGIPGIETKIESTNSQLKVFEAYEFYQTELEKEQVKLTELSKDEVLNENADDLNSKVEELEAQSAKELEYIEILNTVIPHLEELGPLQSKLKTLRAEHPDLGAENRELDKETKSLQDKEAEIDTHESILDTLKQMLACSGDATKCVKCHLKISDSEDITEARLKRVESLVSKLKGDYDEILSDLSKKTSAFKAASSDIEKTENECETIMSRLCKVTSDPNMWSPVNCGKFRKELESLESIRESRKKEVESLQSRVTKHKELKSEESRLRARVDELTKKLEDFKVEGARDDLEKQLSEAKRTLDSLKLQRRVVDDEKSKVGSCLTSINTYKQVRDEKQSTLRERRAELVTAADSYSAKFASVQKVLGVRSEEAVNANADDTLQRAKDLETDRKVAQGLLGNTLTQLDGVTASLDKSRKVLEVMTVLEQLSQLFSPQGITQRYIAVKFSKLVPLVSNYLSDIADEYIVRESETESLAFDIFMTQESNADWAPMMDLSGGQRVKLALSFLMALQQTLCPGINFMALDEPSNHLDEDSRETLADLLEHYGAELAKTQGQLWVVDHSKILQRAFAYAHNF